MAERLQVLDGRHWASLVVEGSLNWERSLPLRVFGLGYYLQSAVTKLDQQVISGEVSFESPVLVNNFNSQRDINDVAISYILTDSLRKTLPDQVITPVPTAIMSNVFWSVINAVVLPPVTSSGDSWSQSF